MRTRGRVAAALGGTIGIAISIGMTSAAGGTAAESTPAEDRTELSRILARGAELDRIALPFDDLTDLLPNVKYRGRSGDRSISEVVVRGRVTSVDPGRAYVPSESSPEPVEVSFEDSRAQWRTVHLTVDVLDALGPGRPVGKTVRVGLALDGGTTLDAVRRGFDALESELFFLSKDSPVFAYDGDLYSDVLDGALIAEVRNDLISLPGFERVEKGSNQLDEPKLLSRANTVSRLRAAADEPSTTRATAAPWLR